MDEQLKGEAITSPEIQTDVKQYSKILLPVILAVIITAILVGGGMFWMTKSSPANNQIVKYNCEQSGGAFNNDKCDCPFEEQLGQTSDSMYDESTGYCQTTHGGPGGVLQEEMASILGLKIIKNTIVSYNCEQSGGTFDNDACSCTEEDADLEYDSTTGYCMTPFGTPGGEEGETAKKLLELEMLKNQ